MQQGVDSTDGIGELQQPGQHACEHDDLLRAHTFDAEGSTEYKAQSGPRGASSAGWGEEDACAARDVAGLPGAGRARVCTPSVQSGSVVSQWFSQPAETDEAIFRDGQGVYQLRGRRGSGFGRVVVGASGVLHTTRTVAAATVRRAKRLFFRDEG